MRHQPNNEMVLDCLAELSSREEQERLWLSTGAHGAEVSSPVEAFCRLFDDSGLGVALDGAWRQRKGGREISDEPVYDVHIDERINALGELLRKIPIGSPQLVIDSAEMADVRIAAAHLLTDLRQVAVTGSAANSR
ncbi:hypothetical protein D3C72_1767370 [compost metagenome]